MCALSVVCVCCVRVAVFVLVQYVYNELCYAISLYHVIVYNVMFVCVVVLLILIVC